MKLNAIILLFALAVSVLSPLTERISSSSAGKGKRLAPLDVCNTAGSLISSDNDIASLHECPCKPLSLEFAGFLEINEPSFASTLFSTPIEQPPRI